MTDLYSSMSQSNGPQSSNYLIISALHEIFSRLGTSRDGYNAEEMRKILFNSGFLGEMLFGGGHSGFNIENYKETLSLAFAYARDNKISLMNDSSFKTWIEENCNRLNEGIEAGNHRNYWQRPSSDYIAFIEAAFISGVSDPEAVSKRYRHVGNHHINAFDIELVKSIAARRPDVLIDIVEDTNFVKNVAYSFRSVIYVALANCGKLSKKAARRIRSDSSEEASDAGVREIATNLHKFENATEVLSQVMDTKHYSSARYLADTIPKQYLPFMAVCQDQRIREIVVNRMHGVSDV